MVRLSSGFAQQWSRENNNLAIHVSVSKLSSTKTVVDNTGKCSQNLCLIKTATFSKRLSCSNSLKTSTETTMWRRPLQESMRRVSSSAWLTTASSSSNYKRKIKEPSLSTPLSSATFTRSINSLPFSTWNLSQKISWRKSQVSSITIDLGQKKNHSKRNQRTQSEH